MQIIVALTNLPDNFFYCITFIYFYSFIYVLSIGISRSAVRWSQAMVIVDVSDI